LLALRRCRASQRRPRPTLECRRERGRNNEASTLPRETQRAGASTDEFHRRSQGPSGSSGRALALKRYPGLTIPFRTCPASQEYTSTIVNAIGISGSRRSENTSTHPPGFHLVHPPPPKIACSLSPPRRKSVAQQSPCPGTRLLTFCNNLSAETLYPRRCRPCPRSMSCQIAPTTSIALSMLPMIYRLG
jgi:hypothetical protein